MHRQEMEQGRRASELETLEQRLSISQLQGPDPALRGRVLMATREALEGPVSTRASWWPELVLVASIVFCWLGLPWFFGPLEGVSERTKVAEARAQLPPLTVGSDSVNTAPDKTATMAEDMIFLLDLDKDLATRVATHLGEGRSSRAESTDYQSPGEKTYAYETSREYSWL